MKKKKPAKSNIRVVPFLVILFFLILGIIGIMVDEPTRVLNQATQICLSCIGIG